MHTTKERETQFYMKIFNWESHREEKLHYNFQITSISDWVS